MSLEVLFLHEHPDWIFKEPRQRLHELPGLCSITDPVAHRNRGFHIYAREEPY
jgi:hypothetical protein